MVNQDDFMVDQNDVNQLNDFHDAFILYFNHEFIMYYVNHDVNCYAIILHVNLYVLIIIKIIRLFNDYYQDEIVNFQFNFLF